mmetsp:Transcript_53777/g.60077  ORF Transcript_53777/g.60077 Transcript_53777/m.60077 type:complete len:518 (+) Transcript_53777:140-1693(+)
MATDTRYSEDTKAVAEDGNEEKAIIPSDDNDKSSHSCDDERKGAEEAKSTENNEKGKEDAAKNKDDNNDNKNRNNEKEGNPADTKKEVDKTLNLMAEPKSELVAAAEADAKNNRDQPAPSETAVRPNNRDVLFGRGKPFQNHPGNRKMLGLIDQYKQQYNESPRDQKRPIVEEIIGILSSDGGRFLRRYNEDVNSTWWTEVPKFVAFDKVSHAFRSRGRPKVYPKTSHSVAAMNKGPYFVPQSTVAPYPHHQGQQHDQQQHQHQQHPQYQHHQGQYSVEGPHGSHQYVQYPGMPMPGHYNPVMVAAAASMQQQPHSAMMGYHPMAPGMSPQQQAMMQAGMMAVMQQQQHGAVPSTGAPPPPDTFGQAQYPPPQSPYHQQQPVVQFGSSQPINHYYGQQSHQQQQQGYPTQAAITPADYGGGGYAQRPSPQGSPRATVAESTGAPAAPTPNDAITEGEEGPPLSSQMEKSSLSSGAQESEGVLSPNDKFSGGALDSSDIKAEGSSPKSENETNGGILI